MNYLKKKKLYELLQTIAFTELDIMKYAEYKFYRGSEWLYCNAKIENLSYELYHKNYFVSLDILKYDEDQDKTINVDRIVYDFIDNKLIKKLQRSDYDNKFNNIS